MVTNLVFPGEAVSKGKTWTNKSESKTPIGKTTTESTYTYEGTEKKDGTRKDRHEPNINIEPDGKSPIKVESAKGSGTILFNNTTGRMVETVVNQKMQMQLGAGGLNFDQNIDQTITIRLQKKK